MKKPALVFASLTALVAFVACGPVQAPECAQWIECQEAIDAESGTSVAADLEVAYGETGTCWSTTAQSAQSCSNSCQNALESLSTGYPEIDACQPAAEAE